MRHSSNPAYIHFADVEKISFTQDSISNKFSHEHKGQKLYDRITFALTSLENLKKGVAFHATYTHD